MKGLHFGEEKKRRREDEEKKRRKEGEVILIKPKDPHLAGVEKEPTPLVFGFFGVAFPLWVAFFVANQQENCYYPPSLAWGNLAPFALQMETFCGGSRCVLQ